MNKPIIGILLGDGAGVGPEIVSKLIARRFFDDYCNPVFIGDIRIYERACQILSLESGVYPVDSIDKAEWKEGGLYPFIDMKNLSPEDAPVGKLSEKSGKACLEMLRFGADLYKDGKVDGFCFVPLNKAAMKSAGCKYESEHHYLASEFGHTGPFGEINVLGDLWTTRTTSHIPLKDVSASLSVEKILRAVTLCDVSLRNSGIENPRIALAALNPHCGENGLCGREEIDIIAPAVEKAKSMGINASGPYPSDITFIKAFNGDFDGVVTMYHDQGQIALKLKGFDQGITIAGGFRCPIVTCAHGTAYDIAGKGIVKTRAFENAVKTCTRMANHLRKEKV